MRLDAAAKRYFVLILCFCLGVAAYFQAAGLMRLVGNTMLPGDVSAMVARLPSLVRGLDEGGAAHATSATAILARNPFDSITGPLDGVDQPVVLGHVDQPEPRDVPRCDGASVMLISESDDAAWSFAAILVPGQKPMLRRAGDELGGFKVVSIGRTQVELESNGHRCRTTLGDPPPRMAAAPEIKAATGGDPTGLASQIHKISDTEYTIEKRALEAIVSRQAELMGSLRITPVRGEGGEVTGLRVRGVKPDSVLGTLGVKDGDQLQRINGYDLANPQSALEAYSKLQNADKLVLSLGRGGKPMDIALRVQ